MAFTPDQLNMMTNQAGQPDVPPWQPPPPPAPYKPIPDTGFDPMGAPTMPDSTGYVPPASRGPAVANPYAGLNLGGSGGVQPGAGAPQSIDPWAALQRASQGAGGAGHAVGLSQADRGYAGSLIDEQQDLRKRTDEANAKADQIANNFQAQTEAVDADRKLGLANFQEQQKKDAATQQQIQSETKNAQSRISAKISDLEASGVDPNHYWQDKGTAGKIMAGIAVGLGAFGATLGHTQNFAQQIISGAVDQDIDAQKVNLQKQLGLLGKQIDQNNTGFDQQMAVLKAQRDSTLTAYSLVNSEFDKRAASFKDNADVQAKIEQMRAATNEQAAAKVGQINQQMYGLAKGAEKIVAPAGGSPAAKMKEIQEAADAIYKAGEGRISVADAHRQAIELKTGVDVAPGKAEAQWGKPEAGKAAAAAPMIASAETALHQVQQLLDARAAGQWNVGEHAATTQALSVDARTNIAKSMGGRANAEGLKMYEKNVPESPLAAEAGAIVGSDPIRAKLEATKAMLTDRIKVLRENPAAAGTPEGAGAQPGEKDDE